MNVLGEKIVLERKKGVAREPRGIFKLRRHVEDADVEISSQSVKAARYPRKIGRR